MCLSVPARVVAVHDAQWATVDVGGTSKRVSIDLVEGVQAGDYVLLHVGFALQKIDEAEAASLLALFDEMVQAEEQASLADDYAPAPTESGVG
ncbi:MAG TPA: HypC/HybG/HupF family hydrogenase formation chaperone [Chloroflexota bacterium]|nr:HypC/HybG/HupF family hydrogenase formation chaperone [Chloroflexota bacterium]